MLDFRRLKSLLASRLTKQTTMPETALHSLLTSSRRKASLRLASCSREPAIVLPFSLEQDRSMSSVYAHDILQSMEGVGFICKAEVRASLGIGPGCL
jgi:hypothetical protein